MNELEVKKCIILCKKFEIKKPKLFFDDVFICKNGFHVYEKDNKDCGDYCSHEDVVEDRLHSEVFGSDPVIEKANYIEIFNDWDDVFQYELNDKELDLLSRFQDFCNKNKFGDFDDIKKFLLSNKLSVSLEDKKFKQKIIKI